MTNRETNTANSAVTALTASMGGSDLSATVDSTASMPASPCYIVIDANDDAKREYIYFDGTFTGTSLVTTVIGNRYLAGSAAGSGLTHDVGAEVAFVQVSQLWTDINDRADAIEAKADTNTTDTATNTSAIAANVTSLTRNTPVGSMVMFAGSAAQSRWKFCDGSAISRTTYSALFAIIGTTYGAGDGGTTFNLPDMRQRFPLGKAASGTGSTLGGTGGAIDHTHAGPFHNHGLASHTHGAGSFAADSAGAHTHADSFTVGSETAGDGGGPSSGQAGSGHYHAVNGSVSSGGAHAHTVSGTSAGSGALATDANAANSTGGGNPPFMSLNFLIYTGV